MGETFEDKLMNLIDEYLARGEERDEIISTMELRVMAMNEEDED